MVQDRVRCGCRIQGYHRRLRICLSLTLALALACLLAPATQAASGGSGLTSSPSPTIKGPGFALARRAMWIWELPYVEGGDVSRIIAGARRNGIGTLMIKSSDGITFWSSQFTRPLVTELHRAGLKVCAWQYVYGNHPVTEAYMGADAVHDGADCLLIDAETEYEGKYVAAQTYIQRLRDLIGANYPVALAGFPYVDFHPAFPYSVFLGPGGAQYNAPQMYWHDIGTTVDGVFAHTYDFNAIYGRPIYPLGQLYGSPPAHQIVRFRQLSRLYGAPNVSWWDWQDATSADWTALSRPVGTLPGYVTQTAMASIGIGATGDLVVWAQEHLLTAGEPVAVDGNFQSATQLAVEDFQLAHGLVADGVVGPDTWAALLRYAPATVVWGANGGPRRPASVSAAIAAAGRSAIHHEPVPSSASRAPRRDEIPGALGAGRPRRP